MPINQNQFDALVSFTYNVGCRAFRNSTLLRMLNQGYEPQAAAQFNRWTLGGGKVLQGLVRRRAEERQMFLGA